MAKKRMFSLGVLDTDAFLDMPLSAQALYFHLNLRADDDGFVGNPKRITQNIGANLDDLRMLVAKRFVLTFEDGVIVIKHWRMHNVIKRDRYTATNFADDMKLLHIKENGAYTFREDITGAQLEPKWNQNGEHMEQMSSTGLGLGIDKGLGLGTGKGKERAAGKPRTRMSKTEQNLSTLEALTENGVTIPEGIYPQVVEWLKYKGERGDTYTERGLKALLKLITSYVEEYGVAAVSALIDECAGNEYRGIIWDKLTKSAPRAQKRQEADLFAMIREEEQREQSGNNEGSSNPAGGIPNFL